MEMTYKFPYREIGVPAVKREESVTFCGYVLADNIFMANNMECETVKLGKEAARALQLFATCPKEARTSTTHL